MCKRNRSARRHLTHALEAALAFAVLLSSLQAVSPVHAEERHGRNEGRPEGRPNLPARAAPPRFQAHPPGAHPHGPMVRPHPVRVLSPRVATYGGHQWRHWEHPEFARPVYYWEWNAVHNITCTAEDSYGDQYPVTEATFAGFGLVNMTAVEDDALDRCNVESGGDQSCYLLTCSHD
jgi:hypothetical protein